MRVNFVGLCLAGCLVSALGIGISSRVQAGSADAAADGLGVNDISFLWPLPQTPDDISKLISVDEKNISGPGEIWPTNLFQLVLNSAVAPEQSIVSSSGEVMFIRFPPGLDKSTVWKIAGIRIDPSAPGCDESLIKSVGSMPQIRLVVQPVTVESGEVRVHDFAAHLAFDFVTSGLTRGADGKLIPAVPDKVAFKAIVNDLVALKKQLQEKGVATDGSLGVHPGFLNSSVDLTSLLREFLKKHLRPERLNNVAFMGVRRPEPWIFFIMSKDAAGAFRIRPQSSLKGATAQMFFHLDRQKVVPEPFNRTFGAMGVSTAPLLREPKPAQLDDAATSDAIASIGRAPKLREIPDIIANPRFSHVLNTDCVSCHTESTLRQELSLAPADPPFAFVRPAGFTGVKPEALPSPGPFATWNVRNFGWGVVFNAAKATVTMRVANEAAESAAFINKNYLGLNTQDVAATDGAVPAAAVSDARPQPVANPLTLVMKAKSPEDLQKLKQLVEGMQKLPPEKNPIVLALEKLGNVHFARFVFLDDKLMVITTFDDDFDAYIDLFVDEIGDVFNAILKHVEGAPEGKVQDHREAFRNFVNDHNQKPVGEFYSAYPKLRVQDIKAFQRQVTPPR